MRSERWGREAAVKEVEHLDILNDVVDLVQDFAVTVHDDADDLVAERQRIGNTDNTCSLRGQIMDVNDLQSGGLQTLGDLRTTRIDSYAIFSDNHIDSSARSDESRDLRNDARDPAPQQRADDD